VIKSNNLHLAGGEFINSQLSIASFDYRRGRDHILDNVMDPVMDNIIDCDLLVYNKQVVHVMMNLVWSGSLRLVCIFILNTIY